MLESRWCRASWPQRPMPCLPRRRPQRRQEATHQVMTSSAGQAFGGGLGRCQGSFSDLRAQHVRRT
eukprot:9904273-Alexandrium_andersonii.AAC.1